MGGSVTGLARSCRVGGRANVLRRAGASGVVAARPIASLLPARQWPNQWFRQSVKERDRRGEPAPSGPERLAVRDAQYVKAMPMVPMNSLRSLLLTVLRLSPRRSQLSDALSCQEPKSAGMNLRGMLAPTPAWK